MRYEPEKYYLYILKNIFKNEKIHIGNGIELINDS